MKKIKLTPPAIVEIIFDIAYLLFAISAGIFLLLKGNENMAVILYGMLAVILGCGDAFHLLPRVYSLFTDTMDSNFKALGFGKLVTSITMTVFYVMLYYVWQLLYRTNLPVWVTVLALGCAVIRIVICVFPQNRWFQKDTSFRFAIYRNIPFVILGAIVAILFAIGGADGYYAGFELMSPAIILSFVFYLAVVLFAGKYKKLGMLMLPKTCTYIWIICMGFSLI